MRYLILATAMAVASPALAQHYGPETNRYNEEVLREHQQYDRDMERQRERQDATKKQLQREGNYMDGRDPIYRQLDDSE